MNENSLETKQPETTPAQLPQENKNQGKKKYTHRYFVFTCGTIALLLLGFIGGQSFERARIRHASLWRDNYRMNFLDNFGPKNSRGMMGGNFPPMQMRSFGLLGTVFSVGSDKISVQEKDGAEQSIQITSSTIIRHNNDNATTSDLKNGQLVAIFGQPNNQGQIAATLIRIIDDTTPTTSTNPTASPQQNISK